MLCVLVIAEPLLAYSYMQYKMFGISVAMYFICYNKILLTHPRHQTYKFLNSVNLKLRLTLFNICILAALLFMCHCWVVKWLLAIEKCLSFAVFSLVF